jgi:hypothetical protein
MKTTHGAHNFSGDAHLYDWIMNAEMTSSARRLLESLSWGLEKANFGGVKAEFEAEGTRAEDLKILLFAARTLGLETIVKIGGCEALRDMRELSTMGRVTNVVAPMIESSFALRKFKQMAQVSQDQLDFRPVLYFNIETKAGVDSIDEILDEAVRGDLITGITFGRGDFTESLGLPRSEVDCDEVTEVVLSVCKKTVERGLEFGVGGSITGKSVSVLQQLAELRALAFESRKVSINFSDVGSDSEMIGNSIEAALRFELVWLETKRDRYSFIANEDKIRISQLESRLKS